MNGLKKKVFSVLLAFAMIVGMIQPMETVAAEPTNIAPGKGVTVSGTSDGNKDNVNDGNTDTKWDSNFIKNGTTDIDDAWIYIDFGENARYEISRIVVKFFNKIYPTSWVIQTSDNAQNWTDVTDVMTKENNGPTHPVETIDFETPVTGRYVRLYFNTLNTAAGGSGIGITEFEVYAEEIQPEGVEWYDVPYNSGAIVYEGTWGQDDLGMNSYNEDAKATLVFYGTGIKWVGQTDSNFGAAIVTIDDGTPVEVSAKGGAATGVTHFTAENLEKGVHTITIEPVGGTIKNDVIDINKLIVQYDKTWDIQVSAVEASIASNVLLTGRTRPITVNVQPFNANSKDISFESSDTAIATVDKDGVVKGVKAGEVEITVTAGTAETKVAMTVKEATAEDQRIIVDNEHPLLIVPLYVQNAATGELQWGDTLLGRWKSIPDDIKENTVMLVHGGNATAATIRSFYTSQLEIAEANDIPLILLTASAGNNAAYTPLHSLDGAWLEEQMQTYSCLKGFMISENHWLPGSVNTIVTAAAEHMKIASEYGGYLFWFDHNRNNYEQMVFSNAKFQEAVAEYGDSVVFGWKNTAAQAATSQNAKSGAYVQGMWLDGQIGQWGGIMDTWKWYEAKYGKLFAGTVSGYNGSNPNGEDEECRTVVMEPEALLGMEMLSIYANGGCVYSFEHPAYTQGIDDLNTPLFDNVIYETFKYVKENPAPTREEVLEDTKVFIHGNLNDANNDVYRIIMENQALPTYRTGRYGLLPGVPAGTVIQNVDSEKVAELSKIGSMTLEQSTAYLNELYTDTAYEGTAFAQKVSDNADTDDTWVLYNSKFNEDAAQTAAVSVNGQDVKVDLGAHAFAILENTEDGLSVYLNNYRVNKNEIWENYGPGVVKWDPDLSANTYMQDWIRDNYMINTKDKEDTYRETVFTLTGLTEEPVVTVTRQKEDSFTTEVAYDAETGTAVITVNTNGYAYFTIGEGSDVPTPPTDVDKSVLEAAVAAAEALHEADYTSESWIAADLTAEITAAKVVLNNDNATQEEVDAAVAALTKAIADLEEKGEEPPVEEESEVVRISGKDRYETGYKAAEALKEVLGVDKFDAVVVATGKNFADALSGSYLAIVKEAPILLTNGKDDNVAELHAYIKDNVNAGGTVYILGGAAAVPTAVEAIEGYTVKRLAGSTRYETNLDILAEAGITGTELLVATGKEFADSLSASAAGRPILLVKPGAALSAEQKAIAETVKGGNIYIVGGTGAVAETTAAELEAYAAVERIAGSGRQETSKKIAEKFFADADSVVVANAKNFPDGLCGGPLAAAMNAPLLLTATGNTAIAEGYIQGNGLTSGVVLGGTGALSDEAVVDVFGLESAENIVLK